MKHARDDYNRIQDPENKIPKDEPVFLLRGQDEVAPTTIRMWALMARNSGADNDIVALAYEQADAMEEWQAESGHPGKVPDL